VSDLGQSRPTVDVNAPRPTDLDDILDRLHRASLSLFQAIDHRAAVNVQYESARTSQLMSWIRDAGKSVAEAERLTSEDTRDQYRDLIYATADVARLELIVDHWRFLADHPPQGRVTA